MKTRALARTIAGLSNSAFAALLVLFSAATLAATPTYDTNCGSGGCHGAGPPSGARINASYARPVIDAANTNHGMGFTTAQLNSIGPTIATEIGDYFASIGSLNALPLTVGYQSNASVAITNLVTDNPGAVVTGTAVSSSPSHGSILTDNPVALSVKYTHTDTNCTADSFSVHGTGSANTAARSVSVTITPPTSPTASSFATSLNYSTSPQSISLAGHATAPASPFSVSITSPPSVGTATTGPGLTVNYAASNTTYTSPVSIGYQVNGPCGTFAGGTITLTVNPPPAPVVTGISNSTANGGQFFSTQILATNAPTLYGVTGTLPTGLSLNTTTGVISGTPTQLGSFPITVSAQNGAGTGTSPATITVNAVTPVITSPTGTFNGSGGVMFSYQITASNLPTSFGVVGTLPTGVTVNTATGLISGIPTVGGSFPIQITATNSAGTGSANITINITLAPPVVTSAATASGNYGQAFSYQISATNFPTSYAVTGALPAGVTLNTSTGLISGTPTATGTFNVSLTATNGSGTSPAQPLAITITLPLPVITSASTATGAPDIPFGYQIVASPLVTSYGVTGTLPTGITLNSATGLISGTTSQNGTFSITVSATNATGTTTKAVTISIVLGIPVITSSLSVYAPGGQPFSYQILAANHPTSFDATGLPTGLTVDRTTGLITGTVTQAGTFNVTVSATNSAGTGSTVVQLTFFFDAPRVTGNIAVSVSPDGTATITFPVTGLFTQINIVTPPAHGTVTTPAPGSNTAVYTPTAGYFGNDSFTFTATGPGGTTQPATVNITISPVAPTAHATTLTVNLNGSVTVDLASLITGSAITGITISAKPTHGTAGVNGTKVTYAPDHDYFGPDSFTYIAFGVAGSSAPATITVKIIGRPDPTKDPNVVALTGAQGSAAQRFARTQITNFQRRLETLHGDVTENAQAEAPAPSRSANVERQRDAQPLFLAAAGGSGFGVAPTTTASSPLAGALANSFLGLAASNTLSIGNGAFGLGSGVTVWAGGNINFGHRDPANGTTSSRFTTDGVSAGVDKRLSDRLALGFGVGYAHDKTDLGDDGSRNRTKGTAIAVYGSYRPSGGAFVDGLLGYGSLDFDSDRFVADVGDFARASRKGDQWFASIAAGYEMRRDGLLLSPYARFDYASTKLKQATESGAGVAALTYFEQRLPMTQATLGLRAESEHETRFGLVRPRARVELSHEFESDRQATIAFADDFGTRYSVTPTGVKRNALLLGVGSDFLFGGGLKLGIDYQAQRTSGSDVSQGIFVMLSQELGAKGLPRIGSWRTFQDPVNTSIGYTYDDNVTRARDARDKLADHVFDITVGKQHIFPLNTNTRVVASAFASAEEFYRYTDLARASAGGQAELQYRSSGAWDAVTLGLAGRVTGDYYESDSRRGWRWNVTASARRALTDRIDSFGAVFYNRRYGKSSVFDLEDYGAKVNFDYSLGREGSLYLAGEYRRGDTVSSGRFSLENIDLADVFTPDEVFGDGFFSYRFKARTWLGTVGYNRPIGPRDAIDFSWRRVQSSPYDRPSFWTGGSIRYIDNQYSIIYLMRF